jgi:hypothetical protein
VDVDTLRILAAAEILYARTAGGAEFGFDMEAKLHSDHKWSIFFSKKIPSIEQND